MKYRTLLICLLIFGIIELSAQNSQREVTVSEDTFLEIREELGYDKTKKGLRLRDKFKPKKKDDIEDVKFNFKGGYILQLVAYALIAALVIGIIYLVFGNIQIDKKIEVTEEETEWIEDIEQVDAETAYKSAMAEGNYRLAVRMLFIMILQKLNKTERIEWEKEKTNRHYYNEISDSDMRRSFREVSNIYEKVWYGDAEMDTPAFRKYDQRFLAFLNTVV